MLVRPIWLAKRIDPNPNLPFEDSPTVINTNGRHYFFICAALCQHIMASWSLALGASSATALRSMLLPSSCCCRRRCFLASVVVVVALKCRRRPRCRRRRWRRLLLLRRCQVGTHPSLCGGGRSRGARALSALPRHGGASPFSAAGGDGGLGRDDSSPTLDAGLRTGDPLLRVRGVGRTS